MSSWPATKWLMPCSHRAIQEEMKRLVESYLEPVEEWVDPTYGRLGVWRLPEDGCRR
jgi:hypothetical protein